ncbi:hypothetical protein FRIG_14925 [Frigoribacterium faeni]|nr:hypothetical protein [Frigoribacterium faeni]MCJ0702411.1 hypothetical protein [Frigoribacterium faeni]
MIACPTTENYTKHPSSAASDVYKRQVFALPRRVDQHRGAPAPVDAA